MMKKKSLLSTLLFCATTISFAQNVTFNDANFKNALLADTSINTDADLTEISIAEAQAVTATIDVNYKRISDLTGIEAFVNVTELICSGNSLTSLDVTKNIALEKLWCDDSDLPTLDVTQNTALKNLNCGFNLITTLDVTKNTVLEYLAVSMTSSNNSSSLSSLDITNNIALRELYLNNNFNLNSLDITKNTALVNLQVNRCNLSVLDLTAHINLESLYCSNNTSLTTLDLSKNSALADLKCSYNTSLSSLNVANGNNYAITSLFGFGAIGNTMLTCIQVDDVSFSNTNWTSVDATATYSTGCSNLSTNYIVSTDYSVYPNPAATTLNVSSSLNIQKVEIYTLLGTKVLTTTTTTINVEKLNSGMYLLKLYSTDGKTATTKFIKQ